jgi:uncharacterized membrane protein
MRHPSLRQLSLTAGALALAAGAAVANDPTFVPLGSGAIFAVSRDGTALLTTSAGSLGVLKLGQGFTAIGNQGLGINTDGTAVAGTISSEANRWTSAGGWTALGGIGAPCGSSVSTGYAVSGDGTVVVGLGWVGCQARGFKWTQGGAMVTLPQSGPNSSRASAVSEDGNVVGGWDEGATGGRRAAIWDASLVQTLPLVSASNPSGSGEVLYVNNDGSAYCGTELGEPWVWSASNGYTAIPRPTAAIGSNDSYWATGCTDDGRVVVGGGGAFFSTPIAWIWTEWGGTQSIEEFLNQHGVTGFNATDLGACRGISASGGLVCGDNGIPFGTVKWCIQLPTALSESYCTAGTSASGCQAQLSYTGVPSASSASGFVVSTAGIEGSKDGIFFYGVNGRQAVSWGNGTSYQCVVPPVKRGGLQSGAGTGGVCDGTHSQDLNARWQAKPTHNPGAGTTGQVQLWYRDPANTSNRTTSLSNALEYTVCP